MSFNWSRSWATRRSFISLTQSLIFMILILRRGGSPKDFRRNDYVFCFFFSFFLFLFKLAPDPEGGEKVPKGLNPRRGWVLGLLYSLEFRQTVRSIRENLSHMSQTINQTDTSYTPTDIAKILGMKTSSIYALISRGYLPANRVGTRRVITARQLNHYLINRGRSDQVIDLT